MSGENHKEGERMAEEKIRINTNRLYEDLEQMNQLVSSMNKGMNDMQEDMQSLDNMWDGPGSETFKQAVAEDIEAMHVVLASLRQIHKFAENAKGKYEVCEQETVAVIDSLRI